MVSGYIVPVNDNGSLIRSYVNQQQQQQQPDQHEQREEEQQQQESTTEEQIPFIEWSIKLVEKYTNLQKEILNLIPELWEPTEFALSVRTILRIKNITLPFAGIVLGPSGGLKTATVELYRNTSDTCYRDSFSAKSYVNMRVFF